MLAMSNANATRARRIQAISQFYRNNITERTLSVPWPNRANIRVSYGARMGDRTAPLGRGVPDMEDVLQEMGAEVRQANSGG